MVDLFEYRIEQLSRFLVIVPSYRFFRREWKANGLNFNEQARLTDQEGNAAAAYASR